LNGFLKNEACMASEERLTSITEPFSIVIGKGSCLQREVSPG
jgi:hypothetical protein